MIDRATAYSLAKELGSLRKAAYALGIPESTLRSQIGRMGNGEHFDGNPIGDKLTIKHDEGRVDLQIHNGIVIVFSDAHFEPGVRTTAFRSLLAMVRNLKPQAVICNGDAFDGGELSRWPSIGWEKKPSTKEELDAVSDRLAEIEDVSGSAELIWPLGNHDMRLSTKIANSLPQLRDVPGTHLKDFFPLWKPCWTCWINEEVCVTHQYHTGMHAVWNNLLKAQVHYVSSHRHTPEVRAYTNAAGRTIYGVDTGCLADALSSHNVNYQLGRHGNHRSSFAVITFKDGELLMPELVLKHSEDTVQFRGHILSADDLSIV